MGVKGLLQFLKGAQRDVHIESFRGQTAAVDAYCWLHKGAYSCALELATKKEKLENLPFLRFCMRRIGLLRRYGITPIVVFDGADLPMKDKTNQEREANRKSYLVKGKALMKEGKMSEAIDCFQRCVSVSPQMALEFIKLLRKEGVQVVVAPYEADAQLAYLVKEGIAHFVVTEDSDLLAFGCPQVFFKLTDSGHGKLIELQDIGKANKSLIGFTPDSFRHMCILCGCDYLASIPGIGPSTAVKLMKKFGKDPFRVIRSLKGQREVPPNYEDDFVRADHTFLYQLVFDPRSQTQVRLTTPPHGLDTSVLEYAGSVNSPSKQVGLARGNINPLTLEQMDSYSPAKQGTSSSSNIKEKKRSSTWSGSVMSKSGSLFHQTTLSVSAQAKKEFKRPKKLSREPSADDEETSLEELQKFYKESSCNGTSSEQDSVQTCMDTSRNIFAKTVVCSKYFASSDPVKEPSGLEALAYLEEAQPSSSIDSGLGSEEMANPYIEDVTESEIAKSDEGESDSDGDETTDAREETEIIGSKNESVTEGMADEEAVSTPSLAKRKLFDFPSMAESKRLKTDIEQEEIIDLTNLAATSTSTPSLRLGLSRTSSKSFKMPRSGSKKTSNSSLLSYFSYKQRDKLKH